MAKYKYEECEHTWGNFRRGDCVAAFVPMENGRREVVPAEVIGINEKTVRVLYGINDDTWTTTIPFRYVCLISRADEIYITLRHYNDVCTQAEKLEKLEGAGVDNWEGYDDAMAEE